MNRHSVELGEDVQYVLCIAIDEVLQDEDKNTCSTLFLPGQAYLLSHTHM
jgi:hypothetical protein